jgi:hypothetical protein
MSALRIRTQGGAGDRLMADSDWVVRFFCSLLAVKGKSAPALPECYGFGTNWAGPLKRSLVTKVCIYR